MSYSGKLQKSEIVLLCHVTLRYVINYFLYYKRVTVTAGTASNTDYSVATSTVLTFGPGLQTTRIIVVTTNEDLIIENDETITAVLTTSSTSVRIDDGVMIVTIKDDDSKCSD